MENDDCIAIKIWCTICSVKKKNTILQMCFCSSDNCCGGCCWWLFAEARLEIVLQWSATVAGRCLPFVHPRESNLRHLLINLQQEDVDRQIPPTPLDAPNELSAISSFWCVLNVGMRFHDPIYPMHNHDNPSNPSSNPSSKAHPLLGLQLGLHRAWAIKGAGQIRPKQGSWWGI